MFAGEFKKQKALFAIADALAFVFAGALALTLHDPSGAMRANAEGAGPQILAEDIAIAAILWFGVFWAFDLYHMRNGSRKEATAIIKACTVAAALMLLAAFAAHLDASRIFVGIFYLLSVPTVMVTRAVLRSFILHFYSSPGIATPLVIIGFNPLAHFLCDRIEEELTQYEIIGFIDTGTPGREYCGYPVLGRPEQMRDLQQAHPCLEAVVAMPGARLEEQARLVDLCESAGVQWWVVPWVYRSAPTGFKVDSLGMIPLLGSRRSNIEGLNYMVKRSFDIICASIALIFVLPVMAVAALAILVFDGSPILYRQQRIGAYGRLFEMLKFRTMTNRATDMVHRDFIQQWICDSDQASTNGHQPNGARSEGVQTFERSQDFQGWEISSSFQYRRATAVVECDPRRNEFDRSASRASGTSLELYKDWHRRRLEGLPGITGLWQVSGRNHVSFDAMVRMDLTYLRDWSLSSDIRILLQTIPVLLRGSGL